MATETCSINDMIGKKFGKLTVVSFEGHSKYGERLYMCRCDCLGIIVTSKGSLTRGSTKSCGCLRVVCSKTHNRTYTREYRAWLGMKRRCLNKECKDYKHYGGRGITICEQWINNFQTFYSDMGKCPPGLTLERINNNGNYEPDNCKWATYIEQSNNNRNTLVSKYANAFVGKERILAKLKELRKEI